MWLPPMRLGKALPLSCSLLFLWPNIPTMRCLSPCFLEGYPCSRGELRFWLCCYLCELWCHGLGGSGGTAALALPQHYCMWWAPRTWFVQLCPCSQLTFCSLCLPPHTSSVLPSLQHCTSRREELLWDVFPRPAVALLCCIVLVCFLRMAAGKACPYAAATAYFIFLKDMVHLTSTPSVFVG